MTVGTAVLALYYIARHMQHPKMRASHCLATGLGTPLAHLFTSSTYFSASGSLGWQLLPCCVIRWRLSTATLALTLEVAVSISIVHNARALARTTRRWACAIAPAITFAVVVLGRMRTSNADAAPTTSILKSLSAMASSHH